jgi:ectoine hydroxylase
MDPRCVDYVITEAERLAFERDGFFVLEDVLPDDLVDELIPVVDRVDQDYRKAEGIAPEKRTNKLDFIGDDDIFLELLDWYKTIPKVWGLMNWNINLYHSHMIVTPPAGSGKTLEQDGLGLGWHQDSGRLNMDFETDPRPMVSLKVAFF